MLIVNYTRILQYYSYKITIHIRKKYNTDVYNIILYPTVFINIQKLIIIE